MSPKKSVLIAILASLSAVAIVLSAAAQPGTSEGNSNNANKLQPPSASQSTTIPPPPVNVHGWAADQFETNPILSLPEVFVHQNTPGTEVPPESLIDQDYVASRSDVAREVTLKEAIYVALRNNPGLAVVQLDPVASFEGVKQANAVFDPDLTSQLDVGKSVSPVTSVFQVRNSDAYTQKFYDWNFGIDKVSALTNGTLALTFDNNRTLTNSTFASVNPIYTPQLELSLSQPLLRNFGWDFARINVYLAESAQRTSQWNYGSSLNDLVQRIAGDYWAVVGDREQLEVQQASLRFNSDLVRVNRISYNVGTLAPIDVQEAESAAATAEANVYAAEAALKGARAQLQEDVMLNPKGTFLPDEIDPVDHPNPRQEVRDNIESALEKMVEYSPALGGLREAIRTSLLQVKFNQNQLLPQLNFGFQFGVTDAAGATNCTSLSTTPSSREPGQNCVAGTVAGVPLYGTKLPFGRNYSDSLNQMLDARFYNYATVLNMEMPLDNAAAKAALAQARVSYEQSRLQYRAALAQDVATIQSALANVRADIERARATRSASFYAEQSLHDEQVRFKVGMATTHDLLQYQSELVTAQGNEVSADIDLENAKIALWHAEGVLLNIFNIDFEVQDPKDRPWYSRF